MQYQNQFDVQQALRNWSVRLGVDFNQAIIDRALKDFTYEYSQALYTLVNENIGGKIDSQEMAKRHRALIRSMAPQIYEEGLRLIGIDELDEEDQSQVRGWIAGQLGYVNDFARSPNTNNIETWTKALGNLGQLAKASAEHNTMVTWRFNPNKDHCRTEGERFGCADLNGTRHRVKWFISRGLIPQEVGSETIVCGGWECGCSCRDDNGKRIL